MIRSVRALACLATAITFAHPAFAREDVPLSPIGLPFRADGPRRLPADHPLFGTIALDGLDALPAKLGPARREAFVAALTETMTRFGMLAPDAPSARFRLTPVWEEIDAPLRISFSSKATARMHWRLSRIDDGRTIFSKEIATYAESTGGSAAERRHGVERIAIMANIASATACLDKAAYGRAPTDCALTPAFTYHAPRPTVPLIIYVRR